ncbi:MAG: hypothetical protein KY428_10100 [Bacteroidetes bacterium]|nr:hypothetical protein [Bacteroidota bacterium]
MYQRNPFLILFILQLLVLASCNKENADPQQQALALLIWTGDPAADAGCGFFIRIDEVEYKPENERLIPKSLQTDSPLPILVSYRLLAAPVKYNCSRGAFAVAEGLRLYSIRKKD